ncbi:MAG: Hsp70 family protein, partial [Planctomycetota bacterium]|nr:Hsp70 family protein [Planctomycetota bacterium]
MTSDSKELLARRQKIYKELGLDFESDKPISLYRLLNVEEGESDSKIISKAYRKQAKKLLSKKARKDRPVVDAIQAEIEHAFAIVKDAEKRERYNGFRTLEKLHERLSQMNAAVDLAVSESECDRKIYQRLVKMAKKLELSGENGKNWVEQHFETHSIKVVVAKAPPPPPPPEPTPKERLQDLVKLCEVSYAISYDDSKRLLSFGSKLGLTEKEARDEIIAFCNKKGWKFSFEAPTPSPAPTTRGSERFRRPKVTEANVSEDAQKLYDLVVRKIRQGMQAHLELKMYVPPFNGSTTLTSMIGGKSYQDRFKEQVECFQMGIGQLQEILRLPEKLSPRVLEHVERLGDQLQGYVSRAEKLDNALLSSSNADFQMKQWKRFVSSKRSSTLAENPPEVLSVPSKSRKTKDKRKQSPSSKLLVPPVPPPQEKNDDFPRFKVGEPEPPPPKGKTTSRYISLGTLSLGQEPPKVSPRRPTPRPAGDDRGRASSDRLRRTIPLRRRDSSESRRSQRASPAGARRIKHMRRLFPLPSGRHRVLAGIDLSRESSISVFDKDGYAILVPNSSRDPRTPSTLLFNDSSVLVGHSAQEAIPDIPSHRLEDYLLYLGDDQWRSRMFKRSYPAEPLVALLMSRLLRDVVVSVGDSVTDVVLSVPGALNARQRGALQSAGQLARINILDVIESSSVVGLDEAIVLESDGPGLVLYLHVGGESLNGSVVEYTRKQRIVRMQRGDDRLGQRAWNDAIGDEVAKRFIQQEGIDPRRDPLAKHNLQLKAWQCLKEIRAKDPAHILIECHDRIQMLTLTLNRFYDLITPLLKATTDFATQLLRDSGVSTARLKAVKISGDPELLPYIQGALGDAFGRKVFEQVEAEPAVGALVWASYLVWNQNKRNELGVEDLKTPGAMDRLVPPKLGDSFPGWTVSRSNIESIGILTETAAGPKTLELVPQGTAIPIEVSRQVG